VTSSRRLRRRQAENGRVDTMGCVGWCHEQDLVFHFQLNEGGRRGDHRGLFVNSLIPMKSQFLQFVSVVRFCSSLSQDLEVFFLAESADQLIPSRSDYGLKFSR
jgi:hypothetical protein